VSKRKDKHLFDHLQNPAYRDEPCRVFFHSDRPRLNATYVVDPGGWREITKIIANSVRLRTAWFPDANVAIRDDAACVWDSLRLAGLRSSIGSTLFTTTVRHELQDWLNNPRHHKERAHAIRSALDERSWARKYRLRDESPILPAVLGYMRLLGFRRFLACEAPDGTTMVGTDPEHKCETMNEISTKIGPRALGLARKGRVDMESNREVNLNDELHCLMAISHALQTGRETVILTADADFLEIFWKSQWFFDTHYRAFLAAELVKIGTYGKPVKTLENTHGYFDGALTLYRRPSSHLREVLPRDYQSIPVSVLYVAPDDTIHKLAFFFERAMLDMLKVRSKTQGRCTDLFGEENIHISLGPLKVELDGLYFGIGHDAGDWVETNKQRTFLSRLDGEHALNCQERFAVRYAAR
jgi:hypothetical protein